MDDLYFENDTVPVTFNKMTFGEFNFRAFYKLNTYDKVYFPTKGFQFSTSFDYYFDRKFDFDISFGEEPLNSKTYTTPIWKADTKFGMAIPFYRDFSSQTRLRLVLNNAGDDTDGLSQSTFIGGFLPRGNNVQQFWGADSKIFSATNFFYASTQIQWNPKHNIYFNAGVNYLDLQFPASWVNNDITLDTEEHKRRFGFMATASYQSIIGPITLGAAKDQYLDGVVGFLNIGFYLNPQTQ